MNLPNFLTVLRVISVPFFIYFLVQPSFTWRLTAFILFALASLTDLVDGYLARKWNQQTEFGKFLDPLADKFLVLGAFITFVVLTEQVQVWMVLCIVGRDMLITALRYLGIRKGKSLRTSRFGKWKTALQMFSIVIILMSFLLVSYGDKKEINRIYAEGRSQGIGPFDVAWFNLQEAMAGNHADWFYSLASFLPYYLMLITTIITILSGLRYLVTNYKLLLPPYRVKEKV
ncbi:MAG TPA: CDP-diacylglycerol--glycerol-3-phosphate 3-phosphatidyltransferase [Leptospiraceae bacterium]|nr:CDP-diacylglycerol--glycerol-3-phosphate 3-phosphatidyltransferase [Leptospiraceae bacterium]HMW58257.1 CDP-diacylglycerol--glycerol-3-phosphate 3-phosphatidyltransferase [Leptospiraceae bacterium]HMX58697.1 CDP-diacylglycerol--glycerol-3-phosphate 3-phosphatidyltransferase [Leptospiraceae bacterium]HMZ36846.1 CDP-diacylglycerol--glycerol-3-phosphate 3-phosphatidyltransferase [Leptospiraceae bacterium]HNE23496.1 CDP-diacylglycerol--glycerol-3-phosphate 3-phosphatidyltransferase [Leptospirace